MRIDIDNTNFTIVIPTHNRYKLLGNLLKSIKKYKRVIGLLCGFMDKAANYHI